jgi:hypothetical protein
MPEQESLATHGRPRERKWFEPSNPAAATIIPGDPRFRAGVARKAKRIQPPNRKTRKKQRDREAAEPTRHRGSLEEQISIGSRDPSHES